MSEVYAKLRCDEPISKKALLLFEIIRNFKERLNNRNRDLFLGQSSFAVKEQNYEDIIEDTLARLRSVSSKEISRFITGKVLLGLDDTRIDSKYWDVIFVWGTISYQPVEQMMGLLRLWRDAGCKRAVGWIGDEEHGLEISKAERMSDLSSEPPIFGAIRSGDPGRLKQLIEGGVDVDSKNAAGDTPLLIAVSTYTTRSGDILKQLLGANATRSIRDQYGRTVTQRLYFSLTTSALSDEETRILHEMDYILERDARRRRNA